VFTMLRFYLLHISPYMFTQILISCFKHILPYVCPIGFLLFFYWILELFWMYGIFDFSLLAVSK
jgi:hypothetical protein